MRDRRAGDKLCRTGDVDAVSVFERGGHDGLDVARFALDDGAGWADREGFDFGSGSRFSVLLRVVLPCGGGFLWRKRHGGGFGNRGRWELAFHFTVLIENPDESVRTGSCGEGSVLIDANGVDGGLGKIEACQWFGELFVVLVQLLVFLAIPLSGIFRADGFDISWLIVF